MNSVFSIIYVIYHVGVEHVLSYILAQPSPGKKMENAAQITVQCDVKNILFKLSQTHLSLRSR